MTTSRLGVIVGIVTFGIQIFSSAVATASLSKMDQEAREYLDSFRRAGHSLPSDVEYERWIQSHSGRTKHMEDDAWSVWVQSQKPSISVEDLRALITAQIDSVYSVHLKYTTIQKSRQPDNSLLLTSQIDSEWWLDREKIRLDTLNRDDVPTSHRISYDGKTEYVLNKLYGAEPQGWVQEFRGRSQYYQLWSPWVLSKLSDTASDFGQTFILSDLRRWLRDPKWFVIEEAPETIDGQKCLVILYGLPAAGKVWLAIDDNYAVAQYAEYKELHSDGEGPYSWGDLAYFARFHNLRDRGSGIYLPDEVTIDRAAQDNGLASQTIVQLQSGEVNRRIDDAAIFTDIFPKGTVVFDTRISSVSVAGQSSDVGDVIGRGVDGLKDSPETGVANSDSPQDAGTPWWIPVGSAAVFIIAVIAVRDWIRKRRVA